MLEEEEEGVTIGTPRRGRPRTEMMRQSNPTRGQRVRDNFRKVSPLDLKYQDDVRNNYKAKWRL